MPKRFPSSQSSGTFKSASVATEDVNITVVRIIGMHIHQCGKPYMQHKDMTTWWPSKESGHLSSSMTRCMQTDVHGHRTHTQSESNKQPPGSAQQF